MVFLNILRNNLINKTWLTNCLIKIAVKLYVKKILTWKDDKWIGNVIFNNQSEIISNQVKSFNIINLQAICAQDDY